MPLCYLAALLAREDAAEVAARSVPASGGPPFQRPFPFPDAASPQAGPAQAGPPRAVPTRLDALGAVLRRLVSDASRRQPGGQDVVRLTARDVAAATAVLWRRAGDRFDPCLPTAHLMAVGPDLATATWVLSELHDDGRTAHPSRPEEHPSTPDRHPNAPDRHSRSPDGHPSSPDGHILPVAPGHAMTIDLGARTPRVMIDDVVFQRARWWVRLPGEPGADAFDRWTVLHRLRAEHGLPRHVFVHHLTEPAPVHVDLCDPLAVEELARRDPAEVLVTEMLPAPGELWWRVAGEEQYAELRLGCALRWIPGGGAGR